MARSLKSKRRKQNNRALRQRYKPKYDAQLQSIVANFQENTDEVMDTAGEIDLDMQVQIVKAGGDSTQNANELTNQSNMESQQPKIKLPKVDIRKVAKFMSQRKYRRYKVKEKKDKKRIAQQKPGQKKKKIINW